METVLSHMVDPALKTVLAAGIAFYFKVCDEGDELKRMSVRADCNRYF